MKQIQCQLTNNITNNIIINNIKEISKIKNFFFLSSACMGWLRFNKEKNLQDLEQILKDNNINVYLIALENIQDNQKASLPYNDEKLKYQCQVSCFNKDEATVEILKYSDSYLDNFEKLKFTGFIISENETFEEIFKKTENMDELQFKLMHNKVKINLIDIDPQKELQKDIYMFKEKYKLDPIPYLISKTKNNKDVFGMVIKINDKIELVSQYGYIEDDGLYKYVLVNDKSTWY
jgi:hypothetical protein